MPPHTDPGGTSLQGNLSFFLSLHPPVTISCPFLPFISHISLSMGIPFLTLYTVLIPFPPPFSTQSTSLPPPSTFPFLPPPFPTGPRIQLTETRGAVCNLLRCCCSCAINCIYCHLRTRRKYLASSTSMLYQQLASGRIHFRSLLPPGLLPRN